MSDLKEAEQSLLLLQRQLAVMGPIAVAVSGGVDSMTLAYVVHRVNPASQQFHALSAAVPGGATDRVGRYAEREGWNLSVIDAGEMSDSTYLSNPVDRCYYCKSCLYDTIQRATDLTVVSGTNLDDLKDYRPGLRAAGERSVRHPYVEAGIDKQQVRAIARLLGLGDLSELPAAPCLSSRITTGIAIEAEVLKVVDLIEQKVWQLVDGSVTGVRCRIRATQVAIELNREGEFERADGLHDRIRGQARAILERHGMSHRAADLAIEPYRMGSAFLIESVQIDN